MDTNLSLAAILASLETQIAHHREHEAFHAGWEAFHQERRAAHAAELEQLVRHLESFQTSVASAAGLAFRPLSATAASVAEPAEADDLPPGRRISINAAVVRVLERKGPREPFGARAVAEEVNRRFAGRLKSTKTVDERQVSVSLRWLASSRRIFRIQKGRPHWEAKYVREAPPE